MDLFSGPLNTRHTQSIGSMHKKNNIYKVQMYIKKKSNIRWIINALHNFFLKQKTRLNFDTLAVQPYYFTELNIVVVIVMVRS